jgi:hypothetical protein
MSQRPKGNSHIALECRAIEDLTDGQIQALIDLGRREAELLDALEEAVASNDRERAWQICIAIAEKK